METELYLYKPDIITRALRNLRAQIIRDGGPGLEHVKALLQIRGNNLGPVPRKATHHFRRGKLRVAIYDALRGGPLTGSEIVEKVCAAHALANKAMYRSVYTRLGQMRRNRLVRHEGRLWLLVLCSRFGVRGYTCRLDVAMWGVGGMTNV